MHASVPSSLKTQECTDIDCLYVFTDQDIVKVYRCLKYCLHSGRIILLCDISIYVFVSMYMSQSDVKPPLSKQLLLHDSIADNF